MLKKTILASALALGLSGVALANGDDVAVSVNTGFVPSFAVGLKAGYGLSGWNNLDSKLYHASKENSFAGGVAAEWNMHPVFALEGQYLYQGSKAPLTVATTGATEGLRFADVQTQAFGLSGKMKYAYNENFGVFTKLGLGVLLSGKLQDKGAGNTTVVNFEKGNFTSVNVMYGAGVSYNVAPNMVAEFGWDHFTGNASQKTNAAGQITAFQPDFNFFGVGLKYTLPVTASL
jgi:opacity protein-like surface antigen